MKIRTDFVTNSSSSSFVAVFKNEKALKNSYDYMKTNFSEDIAATVYDDLITSFCDRKEVYKTVYEKCLKDARDCIIFNDEYFIMGRNAYFKKYDYRELSDKAESVARANTRAIMKTIPYGIYSIISYDSDFYEETVSEMKFVAFDISWH